MIPMLPKDPFILLSTINTKLRDEYADLDDLCASLDINKSDLLNRLADAGFEYVPSVNQFR